MVIPETPVSVDPAIDCHESVGAQGVDTALGVGAHLDEADLAKNSKVARHRRLGQPGQHSDQFTGGPLTASQRIEQNPAVRFGHRFEDVHEIEYYILSI